MIGSTNIGATNHYKLQYDFVNTAGHIIYKEMSSNIIL